MEKSITLALAILVSCYLGAQDSLCVYKVKGSAYLKSKSALETIKKGSFISNGSFLMMGQNATVTAVSSDGKAFHLDKAGDYSFSKILDKHTFKSKASLTTKYLKLIWRELLQKEDNETIIGGVFRGESLMVFPTDSSAVAGSKVTFSWEQKNDVTQYYIFLRPNNSNEVFRFGVEGTSFTISENNTFFSRNTSYEWFVSTTEFPNLKNSPFYTFEFISRNTYEARKLEYDTLISDLKALDFDRESIAEELCAIYGLCKN